jgi:hypothetical protein
MRIVAWPLMHWPLDDFQSGAVLAFVASVAVVLGFVWRVAWAFERGRPGATSAAGDEPDYERQGLRFVGGSLLIIVLVLSLGIKEISQVGSVNQEQYHCVADVLVILGAALVVGGLWRTAGAGRARLGRLLAVVLLAGLTALGVSHWPPLTAPDGGWRGPGGGRQAAHRRGRRVDRPREPAHIQAGRCLWLPSHPGWGPVGGAG